MNRMAAVKLVVLIFTLPQLVFGQNKKRLVRKYSLADGQFYYKLQLFSDSTFIYRHGFKLGDMTCGGKWKIINDTLKLLEQKNPWTIQEVYETDLDTIKGKIRVKVITSTPDSLTVGHFAVRLDSKCGTNTYTNEQGIAEFSVAKADKIYIDYEEYRVKNNHHNSFLIVLTGYPIYTSPKSVTWTDWIMEKNLIVPMECGVKLNHVVLSRDRR